MRAAQMKNLERIYFRAAYLNELKVTEVDYC